MFQRHYRIIICCRRDRPDSRFYFLIEISTIDRVGNEKHVVPTIIARPASIPKDVESASNGFIFTDENGDMRYLDIIAMLRPVFAKRTALPP